MNANISVLPKGNTPTGDTFEQLWLSCSRVLTDSFECFEQHPPSTWLASNEDPCRVVRNSALSCIDKFRNWQAWTDLLACRESQMAMASFKKTHPHAPEPVSCHEQAATVQAYRDTYFNGIITKPVSEFGQTLRTAKSRCAEARMQYLACAEKEGDQSIAASDLSALYTECLWKQLVPVEFEEYKKCRQSNPNDYCSKQRSQMRQKLDLMAADATDSLGMRKSDYVRYGGPYKAFDMQVYPLLHLREAQMREHFGQRPSPL